MTASKHLAVRSLFGPAVILILLAGSFTGSIFGGDTDLWYHLSGGRYIDATGHLPTSNHFSFLEPSRPFTDYYWLFQYTLYKTYDATGYIGIALLRAALAAVALTLAMKLALGKDEEESALRFGWRATLFVAVTVILFSRHTNLRPHTATYISILCFQWVIIKKPNRVWLLPLIALFWVNFHGISYPVLLLLCGAHLASLFFRKLFFGEELTTGQRNLALMLTLSMAAVFATPHGLELIPVPFRFTRHAADYIREMSWPNLSAYSVQSFRGAWPSIETASLIMIAAASLALLLKAKRGELKIHELLLFVGGAYLLSKAGRFYVEFGLLTLPLSASLADYLPKEQDPRTPARKLAMIFAVLLSVTFSAVVNNKAVAAFPYGLQQLPAGSAAFLNSIDTGGKVFNHPNRGGYLQWELKPSYRIFMDMQIPFLFHDEDIYSVGLPGLIPSTLDRFIERYRPDYIYEDFDNQVFRKGLAENKEYRLVFFDDISAVYAHIVTKKEIVDKYGIEVFQVENVSGKTFKEMSKGKDREKVLGALRKLSEIWPRGITVNIWLTQAALDSGDGEEAVKRAAMVSAESPVGAFALLNEGEALKGAGRYRESLKALDQALENAAEKDKPKIHRAKAYTYKALGDIENTFAEFKKGLVFRDTGIRAGDWWQYACAAYLLGEYDEAFQATRYAEAMLTPEDEELRTSIEEFMKLTGTESLLGPLTGKNSSPAEPPGTQTADAPRN